MQLARLSCSGRKGQLRLPTACLGPARPPSPPTGVHISTSTQAPPTVCRGSQFAVIVHYWTDLPTGSFLFFSDRSFVYLDASFRTGSGRITDRGYQYNNHRIDISVSSPSGSIRIELQAPTDPKIRGQHTVGATFDLGQTGGVLPPANAVSVSVG